MLHHTRRLMIAAAVPAIAVSVVLMRLAGVGSAAVLLQVAVFLGAAAVVLALDDHGRPRDSRTARWPAAAAIACLWLPIVLYADAGPRRWLLLGPMHIYVAPVVLPALLVLLGDATSVGRETRRWVSLTSAGVAAGLFLQPDAPQLTAFAAACLACAWPGAGSRIASTMTGLALVAVALASWRQPDALPPVAHVEGVFALAGQHGLALQTVALSAAALPVALLLWHARQSRGAGSVAAAVYFAVLLGLAPLQRTPVPLLGFGAGPILGYALLVHSLRSSAGGAQHVSSPFPLETLR